MRNPAASNCDPMGIKTLVDIQPAITWPDLDTFPIIRQIQLCEIGQRDYNAAVVACETRVLKTAAAADGKCCADKAD